MTDMTRLPHPGKILFVIAVLPVLLLHACASTQFIAGDQKNSLPLMEKDLVSEVHSVVVAPFYHDRNNWREVAEQTLSIPGVSVVPAGGTDITALDPDNRRDALVMLGRSLKADAVLNGVLFLKEDRCEIVLQLISTKDSRVLFWQAADFTSKEGPMDPVAQKELLLRMLGPVLANVAKRESPVKPASLERPLGAAAPKIESGPEAEVQPKTELQPKPEKKTKNDKRRDKGRKPSPPSEDISPM